MKLSMRLPRQFLNTKETDDSRKADLSQAENGNPLNQKPNDPPATCLSSINPFQSDQLTRSFCRFTALVHLAAAIAYSIITIAQDLGEITIPRLKTPVTRNIGVWVNASEQVFMNTTAIGSRLDLNQCPLATAPPAKDSAFVVQQLVLDADSYEIDTRILIIVFHGLSFFFQAMLGYSANYSVHLDKGFANYGHFIEYSISASVLLLAMAAQAMITDIYLLTSIAANCTGCMVLGLMAEILFEYRTEFSVASEFKSTGIKPADRDSRGMYFSTHWIAHFAGWILIAVAMIAANSNLISMAVCAGTDGMRPPKFVPYLVGGEIACFVSFGFVQMYSFIKRKAAEDLPLEKQDARKVEVAYTAEFLYILLSAMAKMYLGLMVFLGNYTNK